MIGEDKLIGWMCVMRLQFQEGRTLQMPDSVTEALVARGWLSHDPKPDYDGDHFAHVTDAGAAITDMHGPDWGINTIPQEAT